MPARSKHGGAAARTNNRALNLGIFYEDNSAKKRWVLKFDNPKALAEIDAVFVTVKPRRRKHKAKQQAAALRLPSTCLCLA